jgi:broad specificity phosphatase PhoE
MIEETIKHYSENSQISLLIRHGDRDKIPQGSFGNEILLNEKGVKNSLKFGECIAGMRVNKILTSPIGRCVQTAEFIAKGYGKDLEIIETKALGDPGLHITDEKIAGEFFLHYGFEDMYNRFVNEINIPGVPKASELNRSLTNHLVENTSQNGLTIFVTHDMLIAFYHYSLNKTIYTKENWIKYLSGLLLKNGKYEK